MREKALEAMRKLAAKLKAERENAARDKAASPKTVRGKKVKDTDQTAPPKKTELDDSLILHNQLTLIEVATPELLVELQADKRIGPLIVTCLSDRVAVVAPGKSELVVKHLLKAGHTPKVNS